MKLFLTVTKKGLFVFLASVVVLFLSIMWIFSLKVSAIDGSTHAKRISYINSLGIAVDEDNFTSKETVIPTEFGEVYNEYNKLQKEVGFDLARFKGKGVTVYSYPVLKQDKNLTLIVCEGNIIGGDIAEISFSGKMLPLGK